MQKVLSSAIAGFTALALATGANAAIINASTTLPAPTAPALAPTEETATVQLIDPGTTVAGQYVSPWGDDTPYWSVQADGVALYDFGGDIDVLDLIWGTIDTYNRVELYDAGNSLVDTIDGAAIAAAAGAAADGTTPAVVEIISNLGSFQFARFYSFDQNAFEHSVLTPEVPVPGALLLLLTGLGGLGFASRRKKAA